MARALIPCYGSGPSYVISDADIPADSGRVGLSTVDGQIIQLNPDMHGAVRLVPAGTPIGAWESAGVDGDLRIYSPNAQQVYAFRVTAAGSVPNE